MSLFESLSSYLVIIEKIIRYYGYILHCLSVFENEVYSRHKIGAGVVHKEKSQTCTAFCFGIHVSVYRNFDRKERNACTCM